MILINIAVVPEKTYSLFSSKRGPEFDAEFASLKLHIAGDESAAAIMILSLSGLKGSMDENTSESSSINGPEFDAQFASLKSDDVGDESAGDIPISSLSGLKGSIDENKSKSIFMSLVTNCH